MCWENMPCTPPMTRMARCGTLDGRCAFQEKKEVELAPNRLPIGRDRRHR
eukprot:NODE_11215_length_193_cov_1.416667_g10055_i0.p4 GENE.NODE_11215_length_193_cov_1.416667_g10055_i0~~NODE_11215_length_193_cov_1.416667_g10055_i0.p4  ORF type:complete len:50 (-),score=9.17 NODE_11215_length_193_cov_1.416667_g10055_i0:43-192(-)